jgi:hypothetical protein
MSAGGTPSRPVGQMVLHRGGRCSFTQGSSRHLKPVSGVWGHLPATCWPCIRHARRSIRYSFKIVLAYSLRNSTRTSWAGERPPTVRVSAALLETTLEYVDSANVRTPTILREMDATRLSRGMPVRTIPIYMDQRHRPGFFWSATTGGHIPYESQLDLARLWFADSAPEILRIAAQPQADTLRTVQRR